MSHQSCQLDRQRLKKIRSQININLITNLDSIIKLRHYSTKAPKTLKSWIPHLQSFVKSKDPQLVKITIIKVFFSFLAVARNVSASIRSQA